MKTRERVLHVSLELFNTFGEPNVTTLQIADEMDISPGNLYYHYKNKSEIVLAIYQRFEDQIGNLLDVPEIQVSVEDYWLFLHLLFEAISQYRFLYKDLVNILHRYERVAQRFHRLLARKRTATRKVCSSLRNQEVLKAGDEALDALCENIVLALTYWPSYDLIRQQQPSAEVDLARGAWQIMSMVAPYLRESERQEIEMISRAYL